MLNEESKNNQNIGQGRYSGIKRTSGSYRGNGLSTSSGGVIPRRNNQRRNFSRIRSFTLDKKPVTGVTNLSSSTTPTQTDHSLNKIPTKTVGQVFHSDRSPLLNRFNNERFHNNEKGGATASQVINQTPQRRTTQTTYQNTARRTPHVNRNGQSRVPLIQGFKRTPYGNNRSSQRTHGSTDTIPKEVFNKDFITTDVSERIKEDVIRIIPLGGVEEIGKNMTVVEYKDDIVIIDMGFQFPSEETPGVDYIIPDTAYLQKKKKNIKGVFITHGHLDHIGGIPYVMERLGNPMIYMSSLTSLLVKKRQDEFPHLDPLNLKIINKDSKIKAGEHLTVRFFNVTHTIPESMGIIIETKHGNIVFTGDAKVDHNNGVPLQHEVETYEKLGKENNIVLLTESTNVERPGWSFSEKVVQENLKTIIAEAKGRLILGTFASLLERIIFIIKTSEELGKKVVLRGRSMKVNVAIAVESKMLHAKSTTIIPPEDIDNYPPNKIVILATGAQGDQMAALMRMSQKKDKYVKINKTDVVLLSSSIIPGNEKSVQRLKDNLSRQGAKIIHYRIADVHSSGHAYYDETLWIHKMIKPKFFIPIHGSHFALCVHSEIAKAAGMKEENIIIPDDGMIIEIGNEGNTIKTSKDSVPSGVIMVDGLGNGDVNDVVIRDRQVLAQDGMFVIIAVIDMKTGKIRQSPDIISRGFIYLKESQELLKEVRNLTKRMIEKDTENMHPINLDYVKNNLREKIGKFLFQNTAKRPIILPVLLEV